MLAFFLETANCYDKQIYLEYGNDPSLQMFIYCFSFTKTVNMWKGDTELPNYQAHTFIRNKRKVSKRLC